MAACPRSSPGREIAVRSPKPPKQRGRRSPMRAPFESVASRIAGRVGLRRVALEASATRRAGPGVSVSTDSSASIWEVTRLILGSPGTSPSAIAHAHGFSAAEVAELLPIFLDNLRTDFSRADGPAAGAPELVPPAPRPGETAEEHAERYLRELAENESLDVVGYDTLGGGQNGDSGGESGGDGNDGGELGEDPTFLDGMEGDPGPPAPDEPSGEVTAFDGGRAAPDPGDQPEPDRQEVLAMLDLAEDDPFAPIAPAAADEAGADGAPAVPDEPDDPYTID
jgi:hypothetical protein